METYILCMSFITQTSILPYTELSAMIRGAVDEDFFTVHDYAEADVHDVIRSFMDEFLHPGDGN